MSARRWLSWLLWGVTIVLLAGGLTLAIHNGSLSEDPTFAVFAIAMMIGYASIGALVASRLPNSPIGWLMLTTGAGFLISFSSSDYARYALYTNPGGLPFASIAVWLQTWIFLVPVGAIVLLVSLFPTGSAASPRWRSLPYGIVGIFALAIIASMFRPGPVDVADVPGLADPQNPLGIQTLDVVLQAVQWVAGLAGLAVAALAVTSLVMRYRAAHGEERQQIRLLAYVVLIAIIFLILTIVTSFGLGPDESTTLNDLLFFVFFLALGIGIPAAAAVAVLRYRLWDLDMVLKKTIVATVLLLLLVAASGVALLLVGWLVVGPLGAPGAALVLGIGIGALAWPLLRLCRRIADRIVYGKRATPYEVLTQFSDRMAESYATDDVLPRMAAVLGAGTGAETVTIWLIVGNQLRRATTWPPAAEREPNADDDLAPAVSLADLTGDVFVVRHQGEQLGAITVSMHANDPMSPTKERLIKDLAGQAGLVLRNVRLIEELRASRRRLVAAQDAERRRLERNIHDGAQQQLVALSVKLRLADAMVERDPAKTHELLIQLQAETTETLEDLRDLARGIYPPLLADKGLAAAIEAQARKSRLDVELASNGVGRYDQAVEAAVYFCCLEALQNVAKYSGANSASVAFTQENGRLSFRVSDDGVGFDPSQAPPGLGLQGMADRIEAIGGMFEIRSAPGGGTTVTGSIPVR
ncbi:MAG TPA: sensor histidine kinase [Actinomycetota bacterium]|nr:sensor histidine kinase [Actinomycetota bacterium]